MQAMRQSSPEYLAAPEVSQLRDEAEFGHHRVVVENYATKAAPGGICRVFVSSDSGRSFVEAGWAVSTFSRAKLLAMGRHWPPDECRLSLIDGGGIEVNYIDHLDASHASVLTARFSFESRRWKVQ